jgi:hypothetical protein
MQQAAAEVRDNRSNAAMAAWARRPSDLVFDAVEPLVKYTEQLRGNSFVKEAAVEHLGLRSSGDSLSLGADDMFVMKDGQAAKLNNHSFNQFCQSIGARAGEWRKYPAALAQVPLTWKAQTADKKDVKMLIRKSENGHPTCAAINSPTYGRIWNHELALAVKEHVNPDIWTVPSDIAFHEHKGFITANDRKVFVFLVNETNPITLPGLDKPLFRGFYAWNSEVGDGTCGLAEFLLNGACANRSLMNLTDFTELKIRHTVGAPDRWVRDAVPSLTEYVNASTDKIAGLIQASREKVVARSEKKASEWLQERGFTKAMAMAGIESAREEERGADPSSSPYSVWNLIQGLTAEARNKENNDDRVLLEQQAGKLMKAVA